MRTGIAGGKGGPKTRWLLLMFWPQLQNGAAPHHAPPPGSRGVTHERFPGYVGPWGRSRLRRQAAAGQDEDARRLQAGRWRRQHRQLRRRDRSGGQAAQAKRPHLRGGASDQARQRNRPCSRRAPGADDDQVPGVPRRMGGALPGRGAGWLPRERPRRVPPDHSSVPPRLLLREVEAGRGQHLPACPLRPLAPPPQRTGEGPPRPHPPQHRDRPPRGAQHRPAGGVDREGTNLLHLSEGTNLLQLSRALGHHSAAFTLTRYTHLLPATRRRRSTSAPHFGPPRPRAKVPSTTFWEGAGDGARPGSPHHRGNHDRRRRAGGEPERWRALAGQGEGDRGGRLAFPLSGAPRRQHLRDRKSRSSGSGQGWSALIDPGGRRVAVRGREVRLAAREFELVALLATEPDRVFTKKELMRELWGSRGRGSLRTLDSHASRVRCRLREAGAPGFIANCHGRGYKLRDAAGGAA